VIKYCCCIVLLFVVPGTLAQSGVVVDRPPSQSGAWPSDTAYPSGGGILSQVLADSFTIDTPAVVRQVNWWGDYWAPAPPATESMQIRVYGTDAGSGLPGAVLLDTMVLDPVRSPTGHMVLGAPWTLASFPEYVFHADLTVPISLEPNTPYWLQITQIGDTHTGFSWELSSASQNGFAFANPSGDPWQSAQSGNDLAFQLSSVPEPTTLVLLILGFGLARGRMARCVRKAALTSREHI
jgi:hypothetical protein